MSKVFDYLWPMKKSVLEYSIRMGNSKLSVRHVLRRYSTVKGAPAGWCHETTVFKIDASVHIEPSPMAVFAARGESLCKSAVRKLL